MILLLAAGFFAGVAVTLAVVAWLMPDDGPRDGKLEFDSPGARRAMGYKPW
jgi:hypothetical protein